MTLDTRRTADELLDERNRIDDSDAPKWPGMSYEDGVAAALDWALGYTDERPMDDE